MKIKWLIAPVLLSILFSGLPISQIMADDSPSATQAATYLTVGTKFEKTRFGDYNTLTAKLIGEDGVPLGERTVTFYKIENFFGLSSIKLGSAVTNAVGIASIKYETSQSGEHQIEAIFAGDETHSGVRVSSTVNITDIIPIEHQPAGLESVQSTTLMIVGGAVLAVWALLAFVALKIYSIKRVQV